MKYVIVLLFSLPMFANSQAPSWQWAKQSIGEGHDYGFSIDTDHDGNSYVTGTFQPPFAVFGTDTLNASTSFSSGYFIAKYDPNGNPLWAKTITGNAGMNSTGIRLSRNSDEVTVTGYFKSTGYISFGTDSIVSTSFFDVYLARYDTSGNSIWTVNAGQSAWNGNINFDLGLDNSGNTYLAGTFEDSVYLKKFDVTGVELWAKQFSGSMMNTFFWSIAVNSAGDNVIAGYFSNTSLQFDNITIPLNSNGYTILLVKSDAQGNVLWAKNDGQIASLYKPDVAIDALDNIYVTGYYNGPTCVFGNTTMPNLGANDIFLVKYNSSGNFIWAQRAGGHHFDQGNSVVADQNQNVYITGMFRLTAAFGPHFLVNNGDPDIYITKYDVNGTPLWAKQAGGTGVDIGYGIALDDSANCYLAGRFSSAQAEFDNIILPNSSPAFNPYEFFIARLGADSQTGINENVTHQEFIIYPNPLVTASTLIIPGEPIDGSYEIFDLRGVLVKKALVNNNQVIIERENMNAGIYMLRVVSGKVVCSKRLMVID